MRVAILIPNFVEFDGGAQNARIQAEVLAKEGHQVAIFTLAADIQLQNGEVFIMGMPSSLFWERIYRLVFPLDIAKTIKWLPKLKGFDWVIAYYYPLTWLAYLAKKLYKTKYTFRYSGIMNPKLLSHLYERMYVGIQIFFTRLTVRNADHAIAVSKFAQEELKKYTGLESEVIHDLVDRERFHPGIDGSKIREELGLGNVPVILSVSAIRPVKGFHLLIQAFNLVKQKIPEARLIIIGKHTFDYYSKQVKGLSDDSVLFIDYVPNKELSHYYAACDLYATCSLWESFNRPLAEAQACGKPAIAFDMGPHPEVIDENGILIETGNVEEFAQACIKKLEQTRRAV